MQMQSELDEECRDEFYTKFISQTQNTRGYELQFLNTENVSLDYAQWKGLYAEHFEEALNYLDNLIDQGLCSVKQANVLVIPEIILAATPPHLLPYLGLPSPGNIQIRLHADGMPFSENFHIHARLTLNRRELRLSDQPGLILTHGENQFCLPKEAFALTQALEEYKRSTQAKTPEERNFAWVQLSDLIGCSPCQGFLEQISGHTRLLSASCLSLELTKDNQIRPVFIAPPNPDTEDFSSILTVHQSEALARYLNSRKPLLGHIPLGNQTYIFLSREVKSTLRVMRSLMHGSAQDKADFFSNPARRIRACLENEGIDPVWLDSVFIETPQFLSDRVKAFGQWSPKHCGFITPIKTEWFQDSEDRFGVNIDGQCIWLTTAEVRSLIKQVETAQTQQKSHIDFKEFHLAVDGIDLSSLKDYLPSLKKEAKEPDEACEKVSGKKNNEDEKTKTLHFGPQLKSNLEELEYFFENVQRPTFTHDLTGLKSPYALYPHQEECFHWLCTLWKSGIPGALLADDMGLGKTLQCLSFMRWILQGQENLAICAPALVVAPTALIRNWQDEGDKYYGEAIGEPLVLSGPELKYVKTLTLHQRISYFKEFHWVIATYETVRDKLEWFSNLDWSLLVMDEAQKIKNPISLLTESIKSVKADFVLALTGTPVENSFLDLWSIMDAVIPGIMGSAKSFANTYCQDNLMIESGTQLKQLLSLPQVNESTHKTYPPLMLRRLKTEQMKSLPNKSEIIYPTVMPPAQRERYEQILKEEVTQASGKNHALQTLQHIAACSLFGSLDAIESLSTLTEEDIAKSARLTALFNILDQIESKKEKVLIFMQRLALQQPLANAIKHRYHLISTPSIINGTKTAEARREIVNDFQNTPDGQFSVAILTSKSAGVGLTLTKANHVIHLERWWNPAVEDQCSDRVYRLGQTKDVQVHIPIAIRYPGDESSFDVKLHQFLANKRLRNSTILMPSSDKDNCGQIFDDLLQSQSNTITNG